VLLDNSCKKHEFMYISMALSSFFWKQISKKTQMNYLIIFAEYHLVKRLIFMNQFF
jgi:hypothetical protein